MKKTNKKLDGKRVSNQKHEIAYVAKKKGVSAQDVRDAKEVVHSVSRKKIEGQIDEYISDFES